MRKSENFGLNLVEGTDVVNPLVQDVPNYEIIDEQMAKNANASIPLATELLSGTVHALTRENPNASMFRFIATSKYTTGDTFTVDGVQVTALLTTGEPLATGCYVINSNVLCCLVGTVLTMFCANSLVDIHAVDSDKLGGKEASYYASTESVRSAEELAQSANQISLNNTNEVDNVRKLVMQREIIWSNPSPGASFAPTIVDGDFSKYEYFEVVVRYSTSSAECNSCLIPAKNFIFRLSVVGGTFIYRTCSISDTSISFGGGIKHGSYGTNGSSSNDVILPFRVYGYYKDNSDIN